MQCSNTWPNLSMSVHSVWIEVGWVAASSEMPVSSQWLLLVISSPNSSNGLPVLTLFEPFCKLSVFRWSITNDRILSWGEHFLLFKTEPLIGLSMRYLINARININAMMFKTDNYYTLDYIKPMVRSILLESWDDSAVRLLSLKTSCGVSGRKQRHTLLLIKLEALGKSYIWI